MDFLLKCRDDRIFVSNREAADVIWKVRKHVYVQKLVKYNVNRVKLACCRMKFFFFFFSLQKFIETFKKESTGSL